MSNWLNGLKQLFQGKRSGRRPIRKQAAAKKRREMVLERLEDRVNPSGTASLNIVGGALTLTDSGTGNTVTLAVAGMSGSSLYTVTVSGDTISLGSGATSAGWIQTSSTVVKGPSSSVSSIALNLGGGTEVANIESFNAPTTLTSGSGSDTVNVASDAPTDAGNLNGIGASLTVTAKTGAVALVASNYGATTGDSNVVVTSNTITGFAGPTNNQTITYNTASGGSFAGVELLGSNSSTLAEKFTIQSPGAPFYLYSEAGPDTANVVSLTASATLNMGSGADTINVGTTAGASAGLDGINGALAIDGTTGKYSLNVSDYGHTSGAVTAAVTSTTITGLAPQAISYKAVGGSFSAINVTGSNTQSNNFTISSTLGTTTSVTGGTANDSFTLGSATAVVAINGVSGGDTLTGANATNAWSITGANAGNVNGKATFTNVGNLVGGTGNDNFTFATGGSLTGTINGGGGTDTITGNNAGDSFSITGSNSGSIASILTAGFSNVQNLIGGSGADSFTFVTGGSLAGTINGGGGTNTITGDNAGDSFSITGSNSGSIASILTAGFSNVQNLVGGSGADSFTFVTGGSLAGTINGGGGTNTITGDNAGDSFSITGSNSGFITTLLSAGFSNVQNLIGGSGADSFTFVTGGSLAGTINGGGGTNTITGDNAGDSFSITGSNSGFITTLLSAGFSNVQNLVGGSGADSFTFVTGGSLAGTINGGGGTNTITGDNAGDSFSITGSNSGSIASILTAGFSNVQNLVGGSGADTFNLASAGSLTGTIDGGSGGGNTLNYAGPVSATVISSGANGYAGNDGGAYTGGWSDINVVNAQFSGVNTLTGENAGSTWGVNAAVSGASTYTDSAGHGSLTFSGFSTLDGGTAADTFNLASGAVGYTISGGGASSGTDTLTGVTNAALTGSSASGFSGTADGGAAPTGVSFSQIDVLDGSGSLTGENAASTWTVAATVAGNSTYADPSHSLTFSGFSTLDGGTAADTFNLASGAVGYTISGGGASSGTDTLTGVTNAVLTGSSASGFSGTADGGAAPTGVSFSQIDVLDGSGSLTGENAASTWTVAATVSGASTYADPSHTLTFSGFSTLDGGAAGNTFNLATGATGYTINGSTGADTITNVANAAVNSSDAVFGTGFTGTANSGGVSFTGIDVLDSSGSGTLTGESTAGTWLVRPIGSTSSYIDVNFDTLSFSGFSTLDAGVGGDTFHLQAGASGYTINGNTGTDTLTGVSNASLSSSSASGFSGTAASSISFSAIDVLDGSGSLTGETHASVWTVNAIASTSTYNDGSDNLSFSGFSTLDGGTGGNTFNLGVAASGYTINGNTGTDTLTGVSNASLSSSSASGFSGTAASSISFSAIDVLDGSGSLTGETHASVWTVNAIASTSTYNDGSDNLSFSGFTTLDGGTGGNTFNLGVAASGYTINGNTGTDTLTGVSNAVLSGSSGSGFSGTAASSISFSAIDVLDGSGSLTGESAASVWTVSASPSYSDGNHSLAFSGFTTLDGGTGGNTFNVSGGASGYTINGNTGTDTLTGVSNASLSSSSASGFSGTAASSISFTAIDVLDGSGSLTGETHASVWTVNAIASTSTYNDGSDNLSFSGFSTLDGGTGGNTFNLGVAASGYTINGNTGTDTLTGVSNAVLSGSSGSGFSGTAASSISFSAIDVLDGSGSLTGDNGVGTTWTVNAIGSNSTYADPSHSLTFSGFSTLDGGSGGSTFNVQSGASGYTINGYSNDTLTGVSNVVLSSSAATGFSGTAASSITFTNIGILDGSGSLTGDSGASTWTINAIASTSNYNDSSDNLTFSGFSTLDGGSGGSTFNVQSGASGYTINGYSNDTLTGVSNVVLSSSAATGFSGAAASSITFTNIGILDGSGSLTGDSGASTWTINAIASTSNYNDSSDNLTFSGFSTLDGGSGGSTFNVQSGASGYTINGYSNDTLTGVSNVVLSSSAATGFSGTAASSITFTNIGILDGSGSLTGDSGASTWTINASSANSTYNDSSDSLTFKGFTTLDGGTGGNTFNLGVAASGYTINGNTGTDTLTGVSNAVLSGSSGSGFSGTAASSISFSAIDVLDGSGSLTGDNGVGTTWTINAIGGNSTYADPSHSLTFSGFSTLDGGSGGSTFNVQSGASGYTINGYSNDTLTGVSNVVLSSSAATGFSGSAASSITFTNIGILEGSGFLTGESTTSTWTLGSPSTYYDGSYTLDFSGFTTLNGSGTDTLANVASATLTGSGASGFSGNAASPAVAFTGMTVLQGTGSAATLTGENVASTWTINAANAGTYYDGSYTLTWSGFGNLTGGSGNDSFVFAGDGDGVSGNIVGGAGTNTLDFSAIDNNQEVDVTISGADANGYTGTATGQDLTTFPSTPVTVIGGTFSNINALIGDSAVDTLTGDGTAATWDLAYSSPTALTYTDPGKTALAFSGFDTLTAGGSGNDTFNVGLLALSNLGTPLTLNGNSGSDTLNASDLADTSGTSMTVTSTLIEYAGTDPLITYSGVTNLNLTAGPAPADARNQIDLESLATGVNFTLTSNGNSDITFEELGYTGTVFTPGTSIQQAFGSAASINLVTSSTDTVTIFDQANTSVTTYTVTDSSVQIGSVDILIHNPVSSLTLYGGSSANIFNVTLSTTTTFNVSDGSGGLSTLNAFLPAGAPLADTLQDNGSYISDSLALYEYLYYYGFNPSNVNP